MIPGTDAIGASTEAAWFGNHFTKIPQTPAFHVHIRQNLAKQPRANRLTSVYGDYGSPPIGVPYKMMTASEANDRKASAPKGRNYFPAAQSGQARHNQTATRCTPMNSVFEGKVP